MAVMLLVLNAALYIVALGLSLAVLKPVPGHAVRRVRAARAALALGGGLAIGVAITLSFLGRWFASGVAGCIAIVIVSVCLWCGLSPRFTRNADDDDDGDDGGGGPRKQPDPPAPPEPAGGPSEELWTEFDRARAVWDRERDPIGS